jgi:hypothetical protein
MNAHTTAAERTAALAEVTDADRILIDRLLRRKLDT